MGRLVFVGLGLWDADDMTVRARDVLRAADVVFAEFYTSRLGGTDHAGLEAALGRAVTVLDRMGVEAGAKRILDAAAEQTVAFVTAGDALTATTHQDLRRQALTRGIPVDVVHGVSIKTVASALVGLSDYKFGRTTTLVFPRSNFFPESPLDVIVENRARGLHTLVLLDIDAETDRYMSAGEGAAVLVEILRRRAERGEGPAPEVLGSGTPVMVVARAGGPTVAVHGGHLRDLAGGDFGLPLHCLVVPGRMTEDEAETAALVSGFGFKENQ